MRRRRLHLRHLWRGLPLAFAVACVLVPAAAAAVRIQSVDTSSYPEIRVTVVGPLGASAPRVREDGHAVAGLEARNLGRNKSIVLAIDRSKSMTGKPLAAAVTAARSFAAAEHPGDHVGVVAFGRTADALTRFSASPSEAEAALSGLAVDTHSGTALYDAIVVAAQRLATNGPGGRAIVVVTDGADVSSTHTYLDAVAAARAARAAVYSIGIGGPSFSPGTLQRLARATGGSYHRAASTGALGDVYTSLQDELARTWQVTYDTTARPGAHLAVTAVIAGAVVHATAVLPSQSETAPEAATGLLPAAAYDTVGTLLLGLLVGGLVLLACGFWFAVGRGARLRSRLAPHLGTATRAPKTRRKETRAAARSRLADAIERVLADVRQFRKVERMIERADMPLRAAELLVVCAASAVVLALLTAAAGAPVLVVFAFLFVGFAVPLGYVSFKASARVKRMENQLPDLLITLAAALKAGHSFRQGIQSVVDEGAEPAASEFKRVLAETQLGKPMDEALVDLAERVGSKNFSFVVTAVTIQRQIGGSLAGLFDMVADTVRQRQQFQRKIRGLTAMGRMSAYVLVGLPFLIGAVISVMNPLYMAPLYHTKTGHELIIIGLVMISVGTVLLRKIVAFKG